MVGGPVGNENSNRGSNSVYASDLCDDYWCEHNNHFYLVDPSATGGSSREGRDENYHMKWTDKNINLDEDFSFSISVDAVNYENLICINGIKVYDGNISKEFWDYFINSKDSAQNLPYLSTWTFGRCSMGDEGWWHYLNGEVYSLKFYNRALNSDEVLANYNAEVAYHNILKNGGNSETSGDLGGEDIGNIGD